MIVVDKPSGASSNDAVQRAKQLYRAQKVGHTGSLDPLATGVLPLCFGEATKFSQFLLDSDKKYWVRIKLGVRTDSGDADGQVLETLPVVGVDAATVRRYSRTFNGEIDQIPSMFSAIKHQGQPLYKLARRGIEVERKSRRVTIYSNELVAFEGDEFELEIHCSKGTYVRTIAEEIGEALGCGAHVCALRRRQAGPYDESDMVSFDRVGAGSRRRRLRGAGCVVAPGRKRSPGLARGVAQRCDGVLHPPGSAGNRAARTDIRSRAAGGTVRPTAGSRCSSGWAKYWTTGALRRGVW